MPALTRTLSLLLCSFLLLASLSCGNAKPPTPILPLVIDPAALSGAVINVPYSVTLKATGGVPP
jgi:hypothetical protein